MQKSQFPKISPKILEIDGICKQHDMYSVCECVYGMSLALGLAD